MTLTVTIIMLLLYFGGLAFCIFSNPMPKSNFEEYAVGGRSFGWPFITMTIIGTWYPGSLLIGWAQMGHDMGISVMYLGYYTLGGLFVFLLMASKLWKLGKKYDLKTMGQFFQLRYRSKPLRVFAGASVLLIEFPWVITELLAAGYAMQVMTQGRLPFNVGMTIICFFFLLYIMFAGTRAVIIADFYQGWMFMIGGIVLFITAIFFFWDSPADMFAQVRDLGEELLTIPGPDTYWGEAPGGLFWTSLIMMGILGGYMWPSLFSRIFAAGSTKDLKASLRITPFMAPVFTVLVFAVAIGSSSQTAFGQDDTAYALVEMVSSMGPVAMGIIACIILAGALSMMDSMISAWAIVFSNDVVTPFKPDISPKAQVTMARVIAVIIGIAGLLIAMTDLPTIVQILTRVYQGIVQVFPAVFIGLFWKRGNKIGAWASIIVGYGLVIYFAWTQPDYVPFLDGMQGGLLSVGIAAVVYIICGFIFKPDPGVDKIFEDMKLPDDQIEREEMPPLH